MTVLFMSLCFIMLGLLLFLLDVTQPQAMVQPVKIKENPCEVQLKRIIEDLSRR